jgi:hypothetical protein
MVKNDECMGNVNVLISAKRLKFQGKSAGFAFAGRSKKEIKSTML